MEYTLVLNHDLTGNVDGIALSKISLSEDTLNFNITIPIDGENSYLKIEATHSKGELSGKAYMDGASVADISGTFQNTDTSSESKGHFGTWTLESSSEEGTKEYTFILNQDLTGTIDGIACKNLLLTAKGLSYSLTIPVGGSPIDLEIEVTIDGDTLDGEAYADGATVADLSGKRVVNEAKAADETKV